MRNKIEHYELEGILGSGAFATVWLAYDPALDGKVAIKVLADNWSVDEDVKRRFVAEARLLHRANDPHFVRVLAAGELDTGQPYLVMEYADRGTLANRLAHQTTALSVDGAVRLIEAVAECVKVSHLQGFVHRDIKPANVLIASTATPAASPPPPPLARDERMMLADFGLAKDVALASGFTRASGSPAYMAPEQQQTNHTIDERADIHALAVTSFEILTGADPSDVIDLNGVLPPVSKVQPHLAVFDEPIARATKPSYADRTATVDLFLADIRKAQQSWSMGPEAVNNPTTKLSTTWWFVAAVVAAALLIGIVVGVWVTTIFVRHRPRSLKSNNGARC